MEIRASTGFIQNLLTRPLAAQTPQLSREANLNATDDNSKNTDSQKGFKAANSNALSQSSSPNLIRESEEETPTGFRRTQDFQTSDGRIFSRTEEFSFSNRGVIRNVVQQNPSGSTTRLEEAFIGQENGLFTRIQRFTDETGDTAAKIESDLPSFFASRFTIPSISSQSNPFQVFRGTQIDLKA